MARGASRGSSGKLAAARNRSFVPRDLELFVRQEVDSRPGLIKEIPPALSTPVLSTRRPLFPAMIGGQAATSRRQIDGICIFKRHKLSPPHRCPDLLSRGRLEKPRPKPIVVSARVQALTKASRGNFNGSYDSISFDDIKFEKDIPDIRRFVSESNRE